MRTYSLFQKARLIITRFKNALAVSIILNRNVPRYNVHIISMYIII